tara:strand:+ start:1064 stop:1276 length:213 start_codon:yes stop_codon:yes gene_type:complete
MIDKKIEHLIRENFMNIVLRLDKLNSKDRESLIYEFKEWIIDDLHSRNILMLPYEAYTDSLNKDCNSENS